VIRRAVLIACLAGVVVGAVALTQSSDSSTTPGRDRSDGELYPPATAADPETRIRWLVAPPKPRGRRFKLFFHTVPQARPTRATVQRRRRSVWISLFERRPSPVALVRELRCVEVRLAGPVHRRSLIDAKTKRRAPIRVPAPPRFLPPAKRARILRGLHCSRVRITRQGVSR